MKVLSDCICHTTDVIRPSMRYRYQFTISVINMWDHIRWSFYSECVLLCQLLRDFLIMLWWHWSRCWCLQLHISYTTSSWWIGAKSDLQPLISTQGKAEGWHLRIWVWHCCYKPQSHSIYIIYIYIYIPFLKVLFSLP